MQRAQFIEGNFSYKWASSTIIEYSTLLQCIVRMHADIKNHFKCFAMCSLARYLWMWIFSTHKYKHVIFCYERQKKTREKTSYKYDSFHFKPYSVCECGCVFLSAVVVDAMLNLFQSQAIWYTLRSHPIRLFQAVLDFIRMFTLTISFYSPLSSLHHTTPGKQ